MPRKLNRNSPSREIASKIIIACEGSETEPSYFKSIRSDLRLPTLTIIVLPHQGKTNPQNIINQLIEKRQEMKREDNWTDKDSVWAVFDGDEHIEQSREKWDQDIAYAKKQKIRLAITNPSFELWYLIHFQSQLARMTRDRATKALEKHIPKYNKSTCIYLEFLKPRTEEALKQARKIQAQIERDKLYEYSNPCCSDLPELVQNILNLGISQNQRLKSDIKDS